MKCEEVLVNGHDVDDEEGVDEVERKYDGTEDVKESKDKSGTEVLTGNSALESSINFSNILLY